MQIDRLINKYKEKCKSSFIHGNRGRVHSKALDKSISENIILLYQNKSDKEIQTMVSHQLKIEEAHPRQEKLKYFGEVIEIDGSIHKWFGSEKVCLYLAIDLCTGTIVGGIFQIPETLRGYYIIFKQILENYGIPVLIKMDNRTVFN